QHRSRLAEIAASLGYFPESLEQIPDEVRNFIASQLNLLWDHTPQYHWHNRNKDRHLSQIRQFIQWRFPTASDKEKLEQWLRSEGVRNALTEEDLLEVAYARLRESRIELPSEKELRRSVNAALNGFFQDLYLQLSDRLSQGVKEKLDQLL